MILDFGHISTEIRVKPVGNAKNGPESQHTEVCEIVPGGKALNQAVAAARTGAEISLIGAIGNDPYGQVILETLERENIRTSSLSKTETPTGLIVQTIEKAGKRKTITFTGANANISADRIPESSLSGKNLLLLQTDVNAEQNGVLLERAKSKGAVTILNLAPSVDLKLSTLKNLDYLIVNRVEAGRLCESLGLKAQDDALKLAKVLAESAHLNCIVTIGDRGCVAVSEKGVGWSVATLEGMEIVDTSGAEDSFTGTFAACIQAGHTLPRAMKRAGIAATLTCTKFGTLSAFPTLEEIDAVINKLKDPKKEELA